MIMCPDSQSLKLHFDIDSRLGGHDGRFCKGLLRVKAPYLLVSMKGRLRGDDGRLCKGFPSKERGL